MVTDYNYIITGATGFVGSVFAKRLISLGCKVTGFIRNEQKAKLVFKNLPIDLVVGDISSSDDVARLFKKADDKTVVIHTVAKVSIGEAKISELMSITVGGTKLVVKNCVEKGVKKLLHISSTEALPKNIRLSEFDKYIPDHKYCRKGYGKTKSMADEIVLNSSKNDNLDASILMFASVIGPGDYTKGHMTQMIIDYIEGKLPASVNAGYNDFDIRDVADVLPNIIEKSIKGETYIFASKPNKISNILDIVSNKLGLKKLKSLPLFLAYIGLPFLWVYCKLLGKRPLYTRSALAVLKDDTNFPIDKAKLEFGFSPRPLEQTISDQVDFLLTNNLAKIKNR